MSGPDDPSRKSVAPPGPVPAVGPEAEAPRAPVAVAVAEPEPEGELDGPDSGNLRDLLRRTAEAPPPPPEADMLRGVQRRLRVRSAGKFYADGWSTREDNPRTTYLITAGVMLLLVVVVYLSLVPGGFSRP